MPKRFNKMITLTMDDHRYVEEVFKGNFSRWISVQLSAHAAGLEHASAMSTKRLLAIVLARQDMEHHLRDDIVDLIQSDELA
jgi:hypothetical protein